jgi:hypothetical protein
MPAAATAITAGAISAASDNDTPSESAVAWEAPGRRWMEPYIRVRQKLLATSIEADTASTIWMMMMIMIVIMVWHIILATSCSANELRKRGSDVLKMLWQALSTRPYRPRPP